MRVEEGADTALRSQIWADGTSDLLEKAVCCSNPWLGLTSEHFQTNLKGDQNFI